MNDLSRKTRKTIANGYAHNFHNSLGHKPVTGTKSMGFVHKKHGQRYLTTKSLPPGGANIHSSWRNLNGGSGIGSSYRGTSSLNAQRHLQEKKEKIVQYFDIELEQPDSYTHRPGEEVNGAIHMDITKKIEIRFLEMLVLGQSAVTIRQGRHGKSIVQKETFLCKRTYVIGTGNARWTSVLTPGHYVSNFKVKLPKDIPSSTTYTDMSTGVSIDISYMLKARLCDDIGSSSMRSVRSITTMSNAVKVLLSKKQKFSVQRPFDVHLIPNALKQVVNKEEVTLSCGGRAVAWFTLGLDRSLFLAGDEIKFELSAQLPSSQRIKNIACILRQHLRLNDIGVRRSFSLSDIRRRCSHDQQSKNGPFTLMSIAITIPTKTHWVSPYMAGSKNLQIAYTLEVVVKLRPAGGQVSFTIPLSLGPCAEPIYAEKTSSRKYVPVFNKTVRFPHFTPSRHKMSSIEMEEMPVVSQSVNVVTNYENSVMKQCFLCCIGGSA